MDLRYRNMQEFEHKINHEYWKAIVVGFFHSAVTWLGVAARTWGTVVLMGGFASDMAISDLYTTAFLVVIVFILPRLGTFTSKLVTKKSLSSGSLEPLKLPYQDQRVFWVNCIKVGSVLLQFLLLMMALGISVPKIRYLCSHGAKSKLLHALAHAADLPPLRQACLELCTTDHSITTTSDQLQALVESCFPPQINGTSCTSVNNIQVGLFAFHVFVAGTCSVAALCNLYVFIRVEEALKMLYFGSPKTLSLTRYHDEVLNRALNNGLLDADEFDTTMFLMRGVGEDLVIRKIAPLEVKRQNDDFITYLFHHPTGVETVIGMLASEETLLQQTAANMPGFWSSQPRGMEKQGMQLLSKLGDKLGMPGKVAEGAANSFKALAVAWKNVNPSPLLNVSVSRSGGLRPCNSAGVPSGDALTHTSGEVGYGSVASVRGGVGEGESTNAVSRSVEGGGRRTGQLDSAPPEPSDATSAMSQEEGQGPAANDGGSGGSGYPSMIRSHEPASSRGYWNGGGSRQDQPEWNVVRKMVDLVVNRRLPTLQVYVRALDSFFMSESVRNSLTPEERLHIKRKLLMIVQGRGDSGRQRAVNADDAPVVIDPSNKARTQLLAFSALERLGAEGPHDETWSGGDLLESLDSRLEQVPEKFVIWKEEVQRYEELCAIYSHDVGQWLTSGMWEMRG